MNSDKPASSQDPWARWLLHERHGRDPVHERKIRSQVVQLADRLLDRLELRKWMTLLDIGTGDGSVALRAIDRVGASLKVILTDISDELLACAEQRAVSRGFAPNCRFIAGSAERLSGIDDASVDAIAMRAVLTYVADKPTALAETLRVLKPSGRISLVEPVLQDEALNAVALRRLVDSGREAPGSHVQLIHRWKSAQYPDMPAAIATNPLVSHSERDLLLLFQEAGFTKIRVELHMSLETVEAIPWTTFLASSPHPLAPTLQSILHEHFSPEERDAFEKMLRPTVEAGGGQAIERVVYVTAVKPTE